MRKSPQELISTSKKVDKDWQMSNAEIREMLDDLLCVLADRQFTSWDREYVKSVNAQFELKLKSGFDLAPVSPKQLAQINRLHKAIADCVITEVRRLGSKEAWLGLSNTEVWRT